jgi:hypothetical protein
VIGRVGGGIAPAGTGGMPGPSAVHSRRRMIERRLSSAFARDRLASALYDVLVEAVETGPCRLHAQAGRAWIRDASADPLRIATDVALATLDAEIARAFDHAPTEIRDWLDASPD